MSEVSETAEGTRVANYSTFEFIPTQQLPRFGIGGHSPFWQRHHLMTVLGRTIATLAAVAAVLVLCSSTARADTIQPVTAADLGPSWHPGCPIDPQDLRRVEVDYVGFDGHTHRGDLIVNQDLAEEVVAIFDQLLQLRYPIERVRTLDNYPNADDELSMEDNNTSAFNCRDIPGAGRWSPHAYGRAVDLNPLLNPEIDRTGSFQPKTAAPYLDRNRTDAGVLHAGDPVVRLFTDRGWHWGGDWRTPKDYQHFER
jgi:hypothetical protein